MHVSSSVAFVWRLVLRFRDKGSLEEEELGSFLVCKACTSDIYSVRECSELVDLK